MRERERERERGGGVHLYTKYGCERWADWLRICTQKGKAM